MITGAATPSRTVVVTSKPDRFEGEHMAAVVAIACALAPGTSRRSVGLGRTRRISPVKPSHHAGRRSQGVDDP